MRGNKLYHYFVEGECEKKLIDELKKASVGQLVSGKVDVLNVVSKEITSAQLMVLNKKTVIILVYDVDVTQIDILEKNLNKLNSFGFKNIVHIQSIKNFEDEIIFSTAIKNINELFNTSSPKEFKRMFINHNDLYVKLGLVKFNVDRLWCRTNRLEPFHKYSKSDDLKKIKIKQ